eukprot:gb/GEZN01018554.1/.p1 GENE.gb/GEZN01018554.1/~~gb/GEZN01018554.1/.p1  ORF type:complete len:162 (+),score=3.29 gb/GEZN01018554.1/:261-746(+)
MFASSNTPGLAARQRAAAESMMTHIRTVLLHVQNVRKVSVMKHSMAMRGASLLSSLILYIDPSFCDEKCTNDICSKVEAVTFVPTTALSKTRNKYESSNAKRDSQKPCFQFGLHGYCQRGSCRFSHDILAPKEQATAVAETVVNAVIASAASANDSQDQVE